MIVVKGTDKDSTTMIWQRDGRKNNHWRLTRTINATNRTEVALSPSFVAVSDGEQVAVYNRAKLKASPYIVESNANKRYILSIAVTNSHLAVSYGGLVDMYYHASNTWQYLQTINQTHINSDDLGAVQSRSPSIPIRMVDGLLGLSFPGILGESWVTVVSGSVDLFTVNPETKLWEYKQSFSGGGNEPPQFSFGDAATVAVSHQSTGPMGDTSPADLHIYMRNATGVFDQVYYKEQIPCSTDDQYCSADALMAMASGTVAVLEPTTDIIYIYQRSELEGKWRLAVKIKQYVDDVYTLPSLAASSCYVAQAGLVMAGDKLHSKGCVLVYELSDYL